MRLVHVCLLVAGAAAVSWGLVLVHGGSTDDVPPPAAANVRTSAADAVPGSRSQVEFLGGPATEAPAADPSRHGNVQSDTEAEADRRRESLREVLGRLEGSPVYVEGIDGPTRKSAPDTAPR